jgi:Flp pilus assembly protein TadG
MSRLGAAARRARDERGSISMFMVIFTISVLLLAGLVYDGGLAIAARQRAADIAEEAARAGANAVDTDTLREGQPLRLDPNQACANARELVRRDGDGSMTGCDVDGLDPSVLHVQVHVTVQPVLLALFHFSAFEATADASSNPLQQ